MAMDREYTPEERVRFEDEVARLRDEELPRIRDEEIKAAAQRAVDREAEIKRDLYRDELEGEVERTAVETPSEEREEAIRTVPGQLIALLVVLLVLALIAELVSPGGLRGMLKIGNTNASSAATTTNANDPLVAQFDKNGQGTGQVTNPAGNSNIPGIGALPGRNGATIDPIFWPYFSSKGGVDVFGLPLDPATDVNGRRIQWFER